MEERINKFVDMFFETTPYSENIFNAQNKIKAKLNEEYQKLLAYKSKDEAFEEIVYLYGGISSMAVLAGYSEEEIERWRSAEDEVKTMKQLKKELNGQRRRIYLVSLLAVFSGIYFIQGIFLSPYNFIFCAAAILLTYWAYVRLNKRERKFVSEKYDTEAYLYLKKISDRYLKRQLNGIALFFSAFTVFIFFMLLFAVFGNSKNAELKENVFANIILIEIPLYICIKNFLCLHIVRRRCNLPEKDRYKKNLIGMLVFSAGYWIIVSVCFVAFSGLGKYPANIFAAAAVLFALLIGLYDLIFRKRITSNNIAFNFRRSISAICSAVIFVGYNAMQRETWYTQPYINSVPVVAHSDDKITYNDETGVYTITASEDDFKILHLTDIHIGGSLYSYSKDIKALKACFAEIEHAEPDLVIVTGDLCFPLGIMSLSLNNSAPINQFAAFMRNTGIPWAFTYGNHDTESIASASKKDLDDIYKSLSYKTSGNLLYPYVQPNVTGRNNQLIELRNADGELNTALFLIDSNAYLSGLNEYDYIHDDQVEWYADHVKRLSEESGRTISSLAFFHIPIQQYRTAYELYEQGSGEVKYFFGENGEKMIDKVCCSDYPSNLFDKMLELGSTTGLFCGHDHYNNMSLEYKGIRLTYGMSIDYLAMPGIEDDTDQHGAELITIHSDSKWDVEQIPLKSIVD